ncbi:cytochrome c oxidase assembly factor Coa1 family protein [Spongiivirga sp. MCCC 1A20706]|uniref:cytochrome c oxidase assembly factor Coa1 family protein n=1 Tax=Spongiivirga sp. MCCC 1A20706 TaxID=3160963 RepID=UPI003977404A
MEENKKSWFGRNWIWAVPLGGCLTIILLFVFGIGALIFGVSEALTGSEPYELAMEEVSKNELVIDALGEPIDTDGMMNGSLNFSNGVGKADFNIPIKGPKGAGRVYVLGTKEDDEWSYEKLYVITDQSEEHIDLLPDLLENLE